MPEDRFDTGDRVGAGPREGSARPWIGIHFECCNVYVRVYRKPGEQQYVGLCPMCGNKATLQVGPGGVNARTFRASPG